MVENIFLKSENGKFVVLRFVIWYKSLVEIVLILEINFLFLSWDDRLIEFVRV